MLSAESELVGFDADAALAAARDTGDVLSFVEFTTDEFRILHVEDRVLGWYDGETHLRDHYETVLGHLHMDFMERDTYERTLLPNAGPVSAIATHMERLTLLRVLATGEEGVYVAVDPDGDVDAVRAAVEPHVD